MFIITMTTGERYKADSKTIFPVLGNNSIAATHKETVSTVKAFGTRENLADWKECTMMLNTDYIVSVEKI